MIRTRPSTRQQRILTESQNTLLDEIREKAEIFENNRLVDPKTSPSKRSASKQRRKAKRATKKFEKLILTAKKNQSNAADRTLPEPPIKPKSIFDQIHDAIKSGEAKRSLKPVVIVIDD